jgi:hypothetical protein
MLRIGIAFAVLASVMFGAEYSLCFLGTGPKSGSIEKAAAQELQKQHMAHIDAMWKAGVLESAGPVAKLAGKRGIFLFSVPVAQAQEWAGKDPKVLAGDLSLECFLWDGPAGVGKAYREAYGKPGFAEKFGKFSAVLSAEAPVGEVVVSGKLSGAPWKYFSVLAGEVLAGEVLAGEVLAGEVLAGEASGGVIFDWYHDPQVWPKP